MSQTVLVHKDDGCWTVTLDRPEKRNALSAQMVQDLTEVIEQARAQSAAQSQRQGTDHDLGQAPAQAPRLLVLQGSGKNFSAGFDFSDWEQITEAELLWRFVQIEQLLQLLQSLPILTVALVHGKNFGAGVDLMAACKHRVADVDSTFRMPGFKFGLVLGTRRLARLVGAQRAQDIQQVAHTLSATEAQQTGLVSDVVGVGQWPEVMAQQQAVSMALTPGARAQLYRVLHVDTDDEDMADLVRSVTEPGLKSRIAKYLADG